jgi:acetyl-CoA/propionyl-CoA carboxylase biotin carboxyl carrier protein
VFLRDATGEIHTVMPPAPLPAAATTGWVSAGSVPGRHVVGAHLQLPGDTQTASGLDGTIWVHVDGLTSALTPLTRRQAGEFHRASLTRDTAASHPDLPAPMPGAVVAVHVSDGQAVATGDRILSIEAMKMEHPITAPHDGTVILRVTVGDQVQRDQIVAVVTAPAHEPDTTAPEGA